MSKEDLIPLNRRTEAEKKAIARKGGQATRGEKASIAGKIGWLRRQNRKLTEKQINMLDEILLNPNASLLNITNFIEEKKHLMDPQDYIRLMQTQHKLMHGEKKQLDINMTSNVTINFGVNLESFNPSKIVEAEVVEENEEDKAK